MTVIKNCPYCGTKIKNDNQFCSKCGARIKLNEPIDPVQFAVPDKSKKSGKKALILCILFGVLGVHRFYVRKIGTGILTLLSGGLLGIWTIIDIIRISQNRFKDKAGNKLLIANDLSPLYKLGLMLASLALWLGGLIACIFIFMSFLTSGLVNTADEQLDALRQGKIAKAYSYTAEQYQQAIPLASFKLWLDQNPELKNNENVVFSQRGISNSEGLLNAGFLEGTLTTKEGKKIGIKYIFLKENGLWKIIGIFPER